MAVWYSSSLCVFVFRGLRSGYKCDCRGLGQPGNNHQNDVASAADEEGNDASARKSPWAPSSRRWRAMFPIYLIDYNASLAL